MKQVGHGGYTYLGITELDKTKETEMKEKITKEYKRKQGLILKSKLIGRNKVTAINTWAVVIVRYEARDTERFGLKVKKNNGNVWRVTPKEQRK